MDAKSIWNCAQNKPSLVVDDLSMIADADTIYETLLRRGIFKWLAVRRDLIRFKDSIKAELRTSYPKLGELKKSDKDYWILRGRVGALEEVRANIRLMTHSERWRVPDNDSRAQTWFSKRTLDNHKDSVLE